MAVARLIRLDHTGHTVLARWKTDEVNTDTPEARAHVAAADAIIKDHAARGYTAVDETGARVDAIGSPLVREITMFPRLQGG